MPTPTYDLIASNTLSSATTTVSFTSIPGTYRDLIFTITGTATAAGVYSYVRVNSDSGTYNYVYGGGYSTTNTSGGAGDNKIQVPAYGSYWSNNFATAVVGTVMDYATTDRHKMFLIRSGGTTSLGAVEMLTGRWTSLSAITSINFTMSGADWAGNTNFQLYGIAS